MNSCSLNKNSPSRLLLGRQRRNLSGSLPCASLSFQNVQIINSKCLNRTQQEEKCLFQQGAAPRSYKAVPMLWLEGQSCTKCCQKSVSAFMLFHVECVFEQSHGTVQRKRSDICKKWSLQSLKAALDGSVSANIRYSFKFSCGTSYMSQ